MTQSPQRGQTAPPSSDFGSVTTQRSAASAGSPPNGAGIDPDARTNGDAANGTTDANTTAQWGTSPFIPSSSGAVTDPALPTTSGSAPPAREANGSFADATTGSLRTDPNGPPPGAPVGTPVAPPPPPGQRSAAKSGRPARGSRPRGPRRARLQLRNINPWTVLKFSCVLSIALFFVWLIVIGVLFGVLDGAGVIGKINDTVTTINGAGSKPPITAGVVFGGAAIIGVVNIVLFIALSTIGSVVYNLCADLVGGIEVTLSER